MQFNLTSYQQKIQHEWFRGLTPQEMLCVTGYYLIGLTARETAIAMGMGDDPKKVFRIARRGAAKAPLYIRADKRRSKWTAKDLILSQSGTKETESSGKEFPETKQE